MPIPVFNESKDQMEDYIPIQDEQARSLEKGRVEKIKEYLVGNVEKDLSMAAVAAKFQLSVSSLQHIFKKDQQQSYRQYVENLRMIKAMHLLKEGKWVKEVINATGYKNRATFNNAFKKRFKHPPGYFRK